MKRRRGAPEEEIPPFIDQFGRPVFVNPLGLYRPNPALESNGHGTAEPPRRPAPPDVPYPRIQGWEAHERHFSPAGPIAPPVRPATPEPRTAPPRVEPIASAPVDPPLERAAPLIAPRPRVDDVLPKVAPVLDIHDAPTRSQADEAPIVGARAQRLAERNAERRARVRLRVRRAGSVAAACLVAFGAMAMFGFRGGDGGGDGTANATTLSVNAIAIIGTKGAPIKPGRRGDVILRIANPNAFAVTTTRVSGGPFPGSVTGGPGCTVANSVLTFTAPPTLNVAVPANGSVAIRLKRAAQMGAKSAKGCRGQTFRIPVSVAVRRS